MERTGRPKIRIRDEEVKAILFRNFAGAPDRFNPNGTMGNFWVVLEEEKARELEEARLNIRWKPNRDGDLEPRLQIFVRWDKVPPMVVLKTSTSETVLDEDTVSCLDYADIIHVNLVLSPNEYDPTKPKKAYLSRGKFTIEEDEDD